MNVLEVYIHELKQHAAMAPCDHTLKRFVLQDIVEYGNLKVNQHHAMFQNCIKVWFLQPNSFVFVSRSAKSFNGNVESVLWCSCDPQRGQIADCLPTVNSECFLSFEQSLPACIHTMAAKILLREVDCINDITPTLDFSGIVLHISSIPMTDYYFPFIRSQLCIHRFGRRMGGVFKWYLMDINFYVSYSLHTCLMKTVVLLKYIFL